MAERKRTYSEQEAAELLQRAAKLQESSSERSYTPGVSIEELERIALEAGIDPKFLELAIGNDVAPPKSQFLGMVEELDRVVEGELDPGDFDEVLAVLGPGMKRQQMRQVGRSLMGATTVGSSMVHVEVTSRNGRTRIRTRSTPFIAYFATLHWMGILGIILGAQLGESRGWLMGTVVGTVLLAMGFVSFTMLGRLGVAKSRELVDKLEDRVKELVGSHFAPQSAALETAAPEVRLDAIG